MKNQEKTRCDHSFGTIPKWDHVVCNGCGWVSPSGQYRGPHGGFFPSMEAVEQYDKHQYYPGMSEVFPMRKDVIDCDCADDKIKPENKPLTPKQRVDRLYDSTSYPTYDDIIGIICDVEFDTLNFPKEVAKRHRQNILGRGEP